MKYTQKSFTVPASGKREGECKHGWTSMVRDHLTCVLCGYIIAGNERRTPGVTQATMAMRAHLIDKAEETSGAECKHRRYVWTDRCLCLDCNEVLVTPEDPLKDADETDNNYHRGWQSDNESLEP